MTAIAGLSILNIQYFTTVADTIIERIVAPHLRWSRLNSITSQRHRTHAQKSWASFSDWLTDRQFRRYFQMSKVLFQQLVDDICAAVGADVFKKEQYIQERIDENLLFPDQSKNIFKAHYDSTGGFISGEIKLAMTLPILGGPPIWTAHCSLKSVSTMLIRFSRTLLTTEFVIR